EHLRVDAWPHLDRVARPRHIDRVLDRETRTRFDRAVVSCVAARLLDIPARRRLGRTRKRDEGDGRERQSDGEAKPALSGGRGGGHVCSCLLDRPRHPRRSSGGGNAGSLVRMRAIISRLWTVAILLISFHLNTVQV